MRRLLPIWILLLASTCGGREDPPLRDGSTLWIVRDPIHVGEPEGVVVTRSFSLDTIPDLPCLVMDVRGAAPAHRRGDEDRSYLDVLDLNGERLVLLNRFVPRSEQDAYTLVVPVEPRRLRVGRNRLRVEAMEFQGGRDNFEWGPVRLVEGSRVRIRVEEDGRPVPCRIQVLDPTGRSHLSFGPAWSAFGAGPMIATIDGEAEVHLPRGEPYEIWASRGLEYTLAHKGLTPARPLERVTLSLDRCIFTELWISGDLHVHAAPSHDSHVPLEDRVVSLIASGVEFAVATDHNLLTDYAPVVASLEASGYLVTAIGEEISTYEPRKGHFNIFPLRADRKPVPFENVHPRSMMEMALKEYGVQILQVNHPRDGRNGYFNWAAFDPGTGKGGPEWHPAFNLIEVCNGLEPPERNELALRDWIALLRHGKRMVATGNSDSHLIIYEDAGFPRNFIRVRDDDPGKVSIQEVLDSLRAGRSFLTTGPVPRVSVGGKGIGERVVARDGQVEVDLIVDAAPWVGVDGAEILFDGEVVESIDIPESREVRRFRGTFPVQTGTTGALVVIVRGDGYGGPVPTNPKIVPLAVTNPIWIDGNGD